MLTRHLRPVRLLCLALAATACDRSNHRAALPANAVQVTSNDVAPLQFSLLRTVSLGRNVGETPEHLTSVIVDTAGMVVLDATSRHVYTYSPSGVLRASFGTWGTGDGQLGDPQTIALSGDTLLVVDATRREQIPLFSRDGRFLGYRLILNGRLLSSAAVVGGRLVTANVIADTATDGDDVAIAYSANGRPVGHGCPRDRTYTDSKRREGVLETYAFSHLTADGPRIVCVQPISPVVHVLDANAHETSAIALIPPFYQAPVDTKAGTAKPTTLDYMATWTYHRDAFVTADGFLSIYSRYDTTLGGFRFFLFRCHVAGAEHQCAEGESPGRVLAFHQPDTLFVQGPTADSSAVAVNAYLISQ